MMSAVSATELAAMKNTAKKFGVIGIDEGQFVRKVYIAIIIAPRVVLSLSFSLSTLSLSLSSYPSPSVSRCGRIL